LAFFFSAWVRVAVLDHFVELLIFSAILRHWRCAEFQDWWHGIVTLSWKLAEEVG
jgi:hypothetical protein